MNTRSLKLIREVMINSGKWSSIEISQDSIYLQFRDVELGTPKIDEDFSLVVRFADDSFFTVFYNNIWDIDFLSKYDFKNQLLSEEVSFNIKDIKFIDFEYLNTFFTNYKKEKSVSVVEDFNIHNIRNDFFMLLETDEIAIVVGGNQMDFFSPFERLDDASLRELSNDWMLYFLRYHQKRNIVRDPMCENHPLKL
ncbi:hypothetical protein SAMN05216439_1859 [Methanobrevibacter gottschalkii]|uniref:Uncharacterized protein n=2 Tax=Methanobrevibacter gottschalkii TaxID=190974 RepID=A0A3N5B2U8_9EURY|nr:MULTISPECIES: hypothetical protein [Methanobrevibacter]MCQ2971120.1 hypothetical protein [archaeon]OEC99561.1 hypothetical protein A9505_00230 [Methanobrevibacter sp. A27]RPF51694.1 hypothetical protein EDC42_1028 [Methanobrevibacter gottschalkii DSM 11977]SEL04230.1 hypothetical protein SAMN05216439_1859 [Methanobrevibacter gottschalkii]